VVAAKFLPGLGAVMPPLAGALGMRASRFLLFDGLGSLFYGTFYVTAGFVFRDQLQRAMVLPTHLGLSALALAVVLVAGYIVFKYARRHKFLSGEARQNKTASQKAAAIVEEPSASLRDAYVSAASFPAEGRNSLGPANLALALTRSGSVGERAFQPAASPIRLPHNLETQAALAEVYCCGAESP
jgi:hypothetical protein